MHLGRVIDEHKLDFERGDFLIRGVLGADPDSGALAVGDELEIGATVQFQVRDAVSADDDLRAMLAGREADGALVFTCNGRGIGLFGAPDHDASVVSELTGSPALAGMFCAGELGPIGGRTFLHGFTASMALFPATARGRCWSGRQLRCVRPQAVRYDRAFTSSPTERARNRVTAGWPPNEGSETMAKKLSKTAAAASKALAEELR